MIVMNDDRNVLKSMYIHSLMQEEGDDDDDEQKAFKKSTHPLDLMLMKLLFLFFDGGDVDRSFCSFSDCRVRFEYY